MGRGRAVRRGRRDRERESVRQRWKRGKYMNEGMDEGEMEIKMGEKQRAARGKRIRGGRGEERGEEGEMDKKEEK